MSNGTSANDLRRAVRWLTIATILLYLALIGAGIYAYSFSRQARQVEQNTKRLNAAVGAACEVGIAPDAQEPSVLHELALGTLVLSSRDCKVIVRKLEETQP